MVRDYMFEHRTAESRRKARMNEQVSLRQQRRDELISKRRTNDPSSKSKLNLLDPSHTNTIRSIVPNFDLHYSNLMSFNLDSVFKSIYEFRRVISQESNPPIQEIIDCGILPRVVELLSPHCSLYYGKGLCLSDKKDVNNDNLGSFNNERGVTSSFEGSKSLNNDNLGTFNNERGVTSSFEGNKSLGNDNLGAFTNHITNESGLTSSFEANKLLSDDSDVIYNIRIESAWIITNLASGNTEQTQCVVDLGVTKLLLDILTEDIDSKYALIDQAIWAVGNISGDRESYRDIIIDSGGVDKIINIIKEISNIDEGKMREGYERSIKLLRNCVWVISNLCRGKNPIPSIQHYVRCFDLLKRLVDFDDNDVVNDSMWAIGYTIDSDTELSVYIAKESGITEKVFYLLNQCVKKLSMDDTSLNINDYSYDQKAGGRGMYCISPLIRIIGNIATGNDSMVSYLLEMKGYNLFEMLYKLYYEFKEETEDDKKTTRMKKEICWIISNLIAGPEEHTTLAIKNNIDDLLKDALRHGEMNVKIEACWGILNGMTYINRNKGHFIKLVTKEIIEDIGIFGELIVKDMVLCDLVLKIYQKMLFAGNIYGNETGEGNIVVRMMDETDVIRVIEDMQDVYSKNVSEQAYNIICDYFGGAEEDK